MVRFVLLVISLISLQPATAFAITNDTVGMWKFNLECGDDRPNIADLYLIQVDGKLSARIELRKWKFQKQLAKDIIFIVDVEPRGNDGFHQSEFKSRAFVEKGADSVPEVMINGNDRKSLTLRIVDGSWDCLSSSSREIGGGISKGADETQRQYVNAALLNCRPERPKEPPFDHEVEVQARQAAAFAICKGNKFNYLTRLGQFTQFEISVDVCRASLLGVGLRTLAFLGGSGTCTNPTSGKASCKNEIFMRCYAHDQSRQSMDCMGQDLSFNAQTEFTYDATSCKWNVSGFSIIDGTVKQLN
ncbi:hypothetical protein [Aquibium microcysteis]|uniref:hypothetical protein n=1 Tax=Aquibium microcysteis TaxID=675281 RepID=UPI00165CFD4E|nr:hypothetical protein [Aquibium microcysteis]